MDTTEQVKITKTTIDNAWRRRADQDRLIIRDLECKGLALFVTKTGMRWEFSYKPRGTNPRTGKRWSTQYITLGTPATHSPDDARSEANKHKGETKAGRDPGEAIKVKQQAERLARANTLEALLEEYKTELPQRRKLRGAGRVSERHAADEIAFTTAALTVMKAEKLPAMNLTGRDIKKMLDALADQPATARARYGALSRFYDWLIEHEHVRTNPCLDMAKAHRPRAVAARRHAIPLPDIAKLWRAADALSSGKRDLARLLMAVPCREGEAAEMEWQHLDLDAAIWSQPAAATKNGDPHRFSLPPLALDLLRQRHEDAGKPKAGLVFPGPIAGNVMSAWSAMKETLVEKSGVNGWRWHDLRRSFVSALGEAGLDESLLDLVINHRQAATRGGVLGVYQVSQRWPAQVAALNTWGDMLTAAIAAARCLESCAAP